MKTMRFIAAGMAIAGAAAGVQAASWVAPGTFSATGVTYPGGFPVLSPMPVPTFNVPTFNIANGAPAGTLTAVKYDLVGTVQSVVTIDNLDTVNSTTVSVLKLGGFIHVQAPPNASGITVNPEVLDPNSVPFFTVLPLGTYQTTLSTSANASATSTDATLLASAILPGTLPWNITGVDYTSAILSGATPQITYPATADYSLVVTYFYDEAQVPEASTWLAMLPIVGFGAWAYQRSRKAKA